jgi:4-coumarate--CoA ligase (photoactive yellow protein activation family)
MRAWWQPRAVLYRFVVDLLAAEMGRLRPGVAVPHVAHWEEAWRLGEDLDVDSLELMELAVALAEALHLHASGIEDYLLARRTVGDWVDVAEAGLARYSERLTFRTSGSTGAPKGCVHSLAHLLQETGHLATLLPGRKRVLCAAPSHHIYGFLFSVLLPCDLGLAPQDVYDLRGSSPAWLAHGARAGDLVVAHPAWWQAVARSVPRLPAGVIGVTSTAPCPDELAGALARAGLQRLVQVYGASETGGLGVRSAPAAPYALFPYWTLSGEREATRRLPDGSSAVHSLQDALAPAADGRSFYVGARHDEAVQVGGVNVFPARVRQVLCRHPRVQDAAVRLMRPEEGTRLKAYVVPRGDADEQLLPQLQAWIAAELATPERPRAITFGPCLPATESGKAADWRIEG